MFLNFVLNKVVLIQEALLFEPVSSFCLYLHFCSCIDLVFTERQRLNLIFGLYAVTKKKKTCITTRKACVTTSGSRVFARGKEIKVAS